MTRTETERLVRIETLLEEKMLVEVADTRKEIAALRSEVKAIREEDIATIRTGLQGEQAARAALENKGKGAVLVLGPVFAAIGAFVMATWDTLKTLFH